MQVKKKFEKWHINETIKIFKKGRQPIGKYFAYVSKTTINMHVEVFAMEINKKIRL